MAEFPAGGEPWLLGGLLAVWWQRDVRASQQRPYPVHGVVSLDGNPLKGGLVRFEPSSPRPSGSSYGAQGTIGSTAPTD